MSLGQWRKAKLIAMNRKQFIKHSTLATGSFVITKDLFSRPKGKKYGHNHMQYILDTQWCKATPPGNPVNDCHEMVQDKSGRLILLTNETANNVLFFNTKGKVLHSWGHNFPGAHGLTLHDENGEEFLYITDTVKHQVYKTNLAGDVLLTIEVPLEADGLYKKADEFVPTETAIDENGDIFIADGYGAQYILHYDAKGKLLHYFGGRGKGDEHLDNAHGICFDRRNGNSLLITDRTRNAFKRFDKGGKLQEVIKLDGACVCRPVIHGDHLYAAVLRSPDLNTEGSGFVTILDKHNKVVSNVGGTAPEYKNNVLQPMRQADKIFVHPHDVCIDKDENIYVAQWASGKVYPYRLKRV
jgi:sugar lactone lactonase YvrE